MLKDKTDAVMQAMAEVERRFGRGAIMMLGDEKGLDEPVQVIPSGSLGLDRALGVGGLPKGRIIEIYGPEASGKTTMALHALAAVQAEGGVGAIVDAEHALDPKYARALGLDLERLLISQPDTGEQALEIVETLLRSGAVDLVVVDSVAALVPRAEIEGEMGDAHVGLQARLMSQAMRKLTGHAAKSKSTLIFINQTRQKIGVTFGSPETTTGGNALKFYCSVRIDVRRIGAVKDGEVAVGNRVRAKVVKNKVSPPFREAEFDILYGRGVSVSGEILDQGLDRGVVQKSGSWFAVGSLKLGQGREKARATIEKNPPLLRRLREGLIAENIDLDQLTREVEKLGTPADGSATPAKEVEPSAPSTKRGGGKSERKAA